MSTFGSTPGSEHVSEKRPEPHGSDGGTRDVIVGIDLGTTNSLVAVCDEAGPRVLVDDDGEALVPSVVRFDAGAVEVGRSARDRAVEFPLQTVYSAKRLMGRGARELAALTAQLAYRVVEGPRGNAVIDVAAAGGGARTVTPEEVGAHVLTRLRAIAEARLGHPVRRAVVTVPAYFDDAQRQATRDAGRIAGLDVVRMVNEPTAASLAYGLGRLAKASVPRAAGAPERIAVYDFGGGTFDVSLLEILDGDSAGGADATTGDLFQVLATAGDTALGGDDIDRAIIDLVTNEIRRDYGAALEFPPTAQQALRRFAESAKIALSERDTTTLEVSLGDERVYRRTLTRVEFEKLARPFVERTIECCRRALNDASASVGSLDRVILVGGSTRMPIVRAAVAAFFEREPYVALDPDQVVALGAAVQGAIIAGTRVDLLLFDVVPLSLGIETVGGAMAKLIVRNSTIPMRAKEMFSTSVDGQTNVKIHVVQGEREMVSQCRSLGTFELRGIPPMPAGIPQIEVELLVDQNGVLDVSAVERRSGRRATIQVVPSYGLTQSEVDRIERDSFAHAREDMHAHRIVDLRVNAALDLKWIGAALDRVRSRLNTAVVGQVEARMQELAGFIRAADVNAATVDADAFYRAKDALDRASMPVHERAITESLRGQEKAEG